MMDARKRVAEADHANSRQVGANSKTPTNPKGSGWKAGGIKQTAGDLGLPEQRIRHSPAIAGFGPETKARAAHRLRDMSDPQRIIDPL
ncbi:hypothetical protein ABIE41_002129 [Bosea sp. OAE506]